MLLVNKLSAQVGVNRVLVGKVRECDMPVLSFTLSFSRSREEWKINGVVTSDI